MGRPWRNVPYILKIILSITRILFPHHFRPFFEVADGRPGGTVRAQSPQPRHGAVSFLEAPMTNQKLFLAPIFSFFSFVTTAQMVETSKKFCSMLQVDSLEASESASSRCDVTWLWRGKLSSDQNQHKDRCMLSLKFWFAWLRSPTYSGQHMGLPFVVSRCGVKLWNHLAVFDSSTTLWPQVEQVDRESSNLSTIWWRVSQNIVPRGNRPCKTCLLIIEVEQRSCSVMIDNTIQCICIGACHSANDEQASDNAIG